MDYHRPVMLKECLEALNIKPDGVYVDLTFGGGGHSKEILNRLKGGQLYGFDQDPDAKVNADEITNSSFTFIAANFRYFKKYLKLHGAKKIDGILADLGVSSHQIDTPERGFSTRFDAALDMRMDPKAALTAREVVNSYSEEELHKMFGIYGEIKNAKTLAKQIVAARTQKEIKTIQELKEVLDKNAPKGRIFKYYAQVFQAIRIEVNNEMEALKEMLQQCADILKPKGRLVIVSYHSLEDRLVKNYMNKGKFFGEVEKDFYGNIIRPFSPVSKKPIEASEDEINLNNRARSAKLRIAERN
ncbi:16S rRNA (cytosine(1402)-N(4))-methyltransferase RsmH [Fulvivirgaceae bacterium BMA10]|uniref:Ribosomal RNA small subunit methyltransferase H n=1 Tax=Splendidivirga corallicola TaxID=3051826 RepID=A0ABT8KN28_9BACT|nr:16S rRNA (cytosine(1402)-N(4))-methyltransferase RsmH [Fulvivirgaceae bacterium BMA10]